MKQRIAIIGAGLAGLSLAHRLRDNFSVTVFDKSRGVGGRMSTRFAQPYHFDHGAQYFTVRDARFQDFLRPYMDAGIVQAWEGRVITLDKTKKITTRPWFEPHFVACPGMNSLCKEMARDIEVELNCEVQPLEPRSGQDWTLHAADGRLLGQFDVVISTAPPAQSGRLLGAVLAGATPFAESAMLPCFALLLGDERRWDKNWIAARANNSPIDWISINATKPDRDPTQTTIVVHSTSQWAAEHVDVDPDIVAQLLRDELTSLTGIAPDTTTYQTIHRWLYAKAVQPSSKDDERFYLDQEQGLAAVGDWGAGSRIEDVWIVAQELGDQLLGR